MFEDNICDKCGEIVDDPKNDAVLLLRRIDVISFAVTSRHLFASATCEGSPSTAQYLEGQPRDPRPWYHYEEKFEPILRQAYAELVAEADEEPAAGF